MNPAKFDVWIWVLIYGGLFTVAVGVFVLRGGAPGLGWTLIALGTVATVAGAALVAARVRLDAAGSPPRRPGP